MCENFHKAIFQPNIRIVQHKNGSKVLLLLKEMKNVNIVDFNDLAKQDVKCFASFEDSSWL